MSITSRAAILIYERAADEISGSRDFFWAADGVQIRNSAFDVTPTKLVTGSIREMGVVLQPNRNKSDVLLQ